MITWYCPDCPFSVGSRSGLTVRDAKNEHEKTCVAQSTGHQLFKGENTMSGYIPTDDEVETAFTSFAFDLENQYPGSYEEAPEFASIYGAAEGFQRYKKRIQADAKEEELRDFATSIGTDSLYSKWDVHAMIRNRIQELRKQEEA